MSAKGSNDALIDHLWCTKRLTDKTCAEILRKIDRAKYTKDSYPYEDRPHGIGYNVTISAPHMHAMCLELLRDHLSKPKARALDVGSGSGYLCAAMGLYMLEFAEKKAMQTVESISAEGKSKTGDTLNDSGENGASSGAGAGAPSKMVVGLEIVEELVTLAESNMRADGHGNLLDNSTVAFIAGDGWEGYAQGAPFDAIHVGAAAASVPAALVAQLALGGRMIIPVGPLGGAQELLQVDKDMQGRVTEKCLFGVRYVPLVQPNKTRKKGRKVASRGGQR